MESEPLPLHVFLFSFNLQFFSFLWKETYQRLMPPLFSCTHHKELTKSLRQSFKNIPFPNSGQCMFPTHLQPPTVAYTLRLNKQRRINRQMKTSQSFIRKGFKYGSKPSLGSQLYCVEPENFRNFILYFCKHIKGYCT